MDKEADQRAKSLADACIDLTGEARNEYLNRECGDDNKLRREVEMMIREATDSQPTQTFSNDYERVLPGHYRLIAPLGRGGMAEVYLAEDTRLRRRVAIKFLNSEFREDPDRVRRFQLEARAASALNHPNILIIHDIGENDGVQYLVSEFIQGEPLSATISRGNIPPAEAVDIAIQIASALAASHHAGIVHRDIKPDNVMLRPDGSVKVLDFGLAKDTGNFSRAVDFDAHTLDNVLSSPGMIMGTPQYMSPEQARGTPLDARTDVFSLGIIIFEMVTGRSPFAGNTMADTIAAILTKEPDRLDQYLDNPPLTLIRIVDTALRKNRDERYGSMELLLSDLRELQRELVAEPYRGHHTAITTATTTRQNTIRTVASRFMHWEPVVLVLVVVLLGAFAWWYFGGIQQGESGMQSSMRSVAITSWSSRPGEMAAAASFSPDTRMVAFASAQSGASEIWVKPAAGGDAIQVTKNGSDNQYPVWSAIGEEIAFLSNRSGSRGIWRSAFTGGAQTLLIGGVGPTAKPVFWSKSGKIYFQEGSELFSADEQSKEKIRVTDFESRGVHPRTIEISTDELAIAYSIKENDLWKVKIERLAAGTPQEIGSSKDQIDHLAWHPNGRTVFYSGSVNGAYQIFQAGDVHTSPVQLSNGNSDFFVQDISMDGSKILYGSVSETSDVWAVDTQSSQESLVANEVAAEYWADISPDGKQVAYQSVDQTDRPYSGSIKVRPLNADPTSVLVSTKGFSPVWAPNGQSIAFFKRSETGIEIWRVAPTGGEGVKLADVAVNAPYTATPYLKVGINHLCWSPNSEAVAYSAQTDGLSNIWVASADGSRRTMLTANMDRAETYCCPTWTPDGSSILFTSAYILQQPQRQTWHRLRLLQIESAQQQLIFESKAPFRFLGVDETGKNAVLVQRSDPSDLASTPVMTDVYSLSIQTGAKLKVNTISNGYFHNIHLSRDGRSIAFVSRRDNLTALWTVPVTGGTPRKLLDEKDPKVLISSLSWSPDGRTIVFGRQTRTNLLSLLAK